MEVLQELEELPYGPEIPLLDIISNGKEISIIKRYLHFRVHQALLIRTKIQKQCVSVDKDIFQPEKGDPAICNNMDETRGHYIK